MNSALQCGHPPLALLTEEGRDGLGNAFGDVHHGAQAGHTHVGRVRGDGDPACAAQAGVGQVNKQLLNTHCGFIWCVWQRV